MTQDHLFFDNIPIIMDANGEQVTLSDFQNIDDLVFAKTEYSINGKEVLKYLVGKTGQKFLYEKYKH
jgi:Zn/Cd-binding protein ZinT